MDPERSPAIKAGLKGAGKALKIGEIELDPPAVMAPMAGLTSWPVRMLCRRMGASLAFTEMISAAAISRGKVQSDTLNALKTHHDDRPLGIQLFGPNAALMAEAARTLSAMEADVVDINMGCPAKKILRSGSGCGLMLDPYRAAKIVAAVRRAVSVPLTVKMRLGWDDSSKNAVEIARICEEEGVQAVTVHGRTRAQGFAGSVDMEGIKEVVDAVNIPVIGNGGIMSAADACRMLESTGCAGVMPARGAIGNPWLFAAIAYGEDSKEANPSAVRKAEVMLQHLGWIEESMPPKKLTSEMRKHLAWYAKGTPGAAAFRKELHRLETAEDVRELIKKHFDMERNEED